MYASLKWLIKCALVVVATNAISSEVELSHSGYASATIFSDQEFYPNTFKLADNINIENDPFSIRTQLTERGISRLAVEYSYATSGNNVVLQLGRVPRLTTLYSDMFGSTSEWGMSVLPLASYNRRMVHASAFNALDGLRAQWTVSFSGDVHLKLIAAGGKMAVTDRCALQQEFTKSKSCDSDWQIKGDKGSYSASAQLNAGDFDFLLSADRFTGYTVLEDKPSAKARYIATMQAPQVDYRVYRWGIKYSDTDLFIQAEGTENTTSTSTLGEFSSAMDASLTAGLRFDQVTPFFTSAYGKSRRSANRSRDFAFGVSWTDGALSASIQRNRGVGAWKRLDTPGYRWDSVSCSVTYKW
jgi:hypothetical protein